METFPVFQAAQRGLIDQDTCHILLQVQLIMGGLLQPDSSLNLSLEQGLALGLIDTHTRQSISELESALNLVKNTRSVNDQQQDLLPIATAMECGLIREEVGLRILELQINAGGLRSSTGTTMTLEQAEDKRLLTPRTLIKLQSRLQHKELIDPNTAEKLNLYELQQRCVLDDDSGLLLLPVKQQPGGTVCLRSGRKVGIFRAIQEGLIDRKVTVRLLEAQLFAGGIADPRSGHRLTIDEAVRHGLMDQDLACAMLARQLQNGGILDPFSGERLDLEEGIRRDLLSSRLAVLVLESLWTFVGILWPESGELLPIAEALQQGLISGELSRNILMQRHAVGALYNPETLQVLPLNQAAEEALDPRVVNFLKDTHIPDVLFSMNKSGTPSLNRMSLGSSSSSPPSSPPPPSSPEGILWDNTLTQQIDPEEQAKQKLLFHLMTHSYVDAHSGKRLVLLDPELVELLNAAVLVSRDSVFVSQVEPQSTLNADELGNICLTDKGVSDKQTEVAEKSSNEITPGIEFEMNGTGNREERCNGENNYKLLHEPLTIEESDIAFAAKNEIGVDKDIKVKTQMEEISSLESLMTSAKNMKAKFTKGPDELVATESKPRVSNVQETRNIEEEFTRGPDELVATESEPGVSSVQETRSRTISAAEITKETDSNHAKPQMDLLESTVEKEGEDAELARLVLELKQGGLLTEEGEKLLPDEAVAQGVLPGYMAVKLMAEAGMFGGFLDASSGESLSMEDILEDGLLDEDLMWSVLKSEKSLSGVVDVEKQQICSIKEAAQAGLIDSNTATRLLEAQVVSGGIVDLRRDEKVSVTSAANLGLIGEDQREELMALERAYKGKDTDPATTLAKASLQLQMEGVIDPESKSPIPLEQAIQKGLITSEEAYQVLSRQVAEGGIIHHASRIRLSVSDAVDRGLVDRSIASGLEELEWIYEGKACPSSHPEAAILQASTGAILDPESGSKLTLTEAVSKGLLDEDVANEAVASPTVAEGLIDPQTACIVPFSELVNQGKIDIETGKRFLEVKPFRGIKDKNTTDNLTIPQAVASRKVDPIPAFRLLQSQSDSGGIVDITTGERLPLLEACKRDLVVDSMARVIATNQFQKGGVVDPAIGQQISSLDDAIAKGLISSEMASGLQKDLASVETEDNEGSATPVASSNGTYSPAVMSSVSGPDSPANWSGVCSDQVPCSFSLSEKGVSNTDDNGKTLTAADQSQLYDTTIEEDKIEVSSEVEEKALAEPDQSIDLLSKFATNVEKRIQQAIEEMVPPSDIDESEPLPQQKLDEQLQTDASESDCKQMKNIDSVGGSVQAHVYDTDKESVGEKGADVFKLDGEPVKVEETECRPSDENTAGYLDSGDGNLTAAEVRDDRESKVGLDKCSEVDYKKSYVAAQQDDLENERGERVEKVKALKTEIESSTDIEQPGLLLTSPSKVTHSKSKKKRKNKKNGKGREAEVETFSPETKHSSEIDQADANIEGKPEAFDEAQDEIEKYEKSQIDFEAAIRLTPSGEGEATIDRKSAEDYLAKQGQKAVPDSIEFTGGNTALSKDTEKIDNMAEMKMKERKDKVEEKASFSRQPERTETSQEVKKRKELELPQKSALPDNEKAALILKAKESILKKVFEKGVSEKQTAMELQALRNEVGKKESQGNAGKETKTKPLPAKVNGAENLKDVRGKRLNGSPNESDKDGMEVKKVKKDAPLEKDSIKENVKTKLLEASINERENKGGVGKEDTQKDVRTDPSVQPKGIQQSKRSKKNKNKTPKVTDMTEADDENLKVEPQVAKIPTDAGKSLSVTDRHTDGQPASDEANDMETSPMNAEGTENRPQSLPDLLESEEHMKLFTFTGEEEAAQKSHLGTRNAAVDVLTGQSDIQPTAQSVDPDAQPDIKARKGKKKNRLQPSEGDGTTGSESKPLKDQKQNLESSESAEDASTLHQSPGVPESDTANESLEVGDYDVIESQEIVSDNEGTSKTGKVRSNG